MPDLSPDTVANIVIGLIAVGGSILGAILGAREGARASLAATKAFAEENEQRQRDAVRLRLRVEIDHNLASLRTLRDKLIAKATPKSHDGSVENPKLSWTSYGQAFVLGVMPAWTRQAWESMMALPAAALEPKEIEQVNHFYGQLETISGIRDQLTPMVNEKPHMEDPFGTGARSVEPMSLYIYGPGLAAQADRIMADLIERGNPIAEA
jgi:hypothetical protein